MDDEWEIVHSYTRQQAIKDGVLIECNSLAKEAGYKVPVAITVGLDVKYLDNFQGGTGQSREGRLWDVLMVLLFKIKEGGGEDNILLFQVTFQMKEGMIDVTLRAEIGPGDNSEPVMTIGLPNDF